MTTSSTARQPKSITTGGQFASTLHSESPVSLADSSPAAVLNSACGTDRDPLSIPVPDKGPTRGYVEAYVNSDALRGVLEDNGFDGDEADRYDRVYAGISLHTAREADFHGETADGGSHVIAMGIHDFEAAIDPDNHAGLSYRPGHSDPVPAYEAAFEEVREQRLAASKELLHDAGVTVEAHDVRRGEYTLSAGGRRLRLKTGTLRMPQVIETRNWMPADEADVDEFLDGETSRDATVLMSRCANLVALDLQDRHNKEKNA